MTSSVKPEKLLFVTGMHRSGTSALCAALAACGASFGDQLIDALAGVNDEGFWEDARVVALNEQLLSQLDSTWFAPAPELVTTDWKQEQFAPLADQAAALLAGGFGASPVQAVKDPRLCLTLPLWLARCAELSIEAHVCVIGRAPLAVARSLERRDGFPLGYGLRLFARYRGCLEAFVPKGAVFLRYEDLLEDAGAVIRRLAADLPLAMEDVDLATAVRQDLRHQLAGEGSALLATADSGNIDLAALDLEIETRFPTDLTLREFARRLTERGVELARIGEAHSTALATLDQRDRDIEALSAEHRAALATLDERDADINGLAEEHRIALATIDERDQQIREFDRRLSRLGEEHAFALQTLRERDAELAWIKQRLDYVSKVPGVGYLLKRLRKHAQG